MNFDSRVALRTRSAQDSRNLISANGCEVLPKYGKGDYITPESTVLYDFPMYNHTDTEYLVNFWEKQKVSAHLPRFISALLFVLRS